MSRTEHEGKAGSEEGKMDTIRRIRIDNIEEIEEEEVKNTKSKIHYLFSSFLSKLMYFFPWVPKYVKLKTKTLFSWI